MWWSVVNFVKNLSLLKEVERSNEDYFYRYNEVLRPDNRSERVLDSESLVRSSNTQLSWGRGGPRTHQVQRSKVLPRPQFPSQGFGLTDPSLGLCLEK